MSLIVAARRKFGFAGELLSFFVTQKRWWMLPMITLLALLGIFMILAEGSAIAPFIYTLF